MKQAIRYAKAIGLAACQGLLMATLIMAPVALSGCNPTTAVNAIGAVANTFLSNCGTFTVNPVDLAACTAINGAVQASVTEFDTTYAAWVAAKGSGSTLSAVEAAVTAALKNLPAALANFKIVDANSQTKILGEIELIVSAFELVAGFFGVATPAMSAHLQRATSGTVTMVKKGDWRGADKQAKTLKAQWNVSVCGGLTGAQLASCTVR